MSEIEKMYENAKIDNYRLENFCGLVPKGYTTIDDKERKGYVKVVRDFSPEKQLELIKWLSNNDKDKNKEMCIYNSSHPYFYFGLYHNEDIEDNSYGYGESLSLTFEEGIANLINSLWQDLTESEQEQIRSILNG